MDQPGLGVIREALGRGGVEAEDGEVTRWRSGGRGEPGRGMTEALRWDHVWRVRRAARRGCG